MVAYSKCFNAYRYAWNKPLTYKIYKSAISFKWRTILGSWKRPDEFMPSKGSECLIQKASTNSHWVSETYINILVIFHSSYYLGLNISVSSSCKPCSRGYRGGGRGSYHDQNRHGRPDSGFDRGPVGFSRESTVRKLYCGIVVWFHK